LKKKKKEQEKEKEEEEEEEEEETYRKWHGVGGTLFWWLFTLSAAPLLGSD
jgi:hypothetical protein